MQYLQPGAPALQQPHPPGGRPQHALTWHGSGRSSGSSDGGGVASARHEAAKLHGQVDSAVLAAEAHTLPGVSLYYCEHVHGVPHTLSRLVRFV